ncbi:DegT/DnrJ/EryC1/StrS family aminotransferase [Paenibacillaceae bacterium]|nr:DegT/DnrJ/EryC1/StrS family aminotransferase [Paenibacillaceae bacterium]
MSTQLFIPKYRVEECLDEIRKSLECGWTGLGHRTVEFENIWKVYTGLSHAHFVNSATAGLYMAVEILKAANQWADGDEIISTPITFVSTNHAILHNNLKVTFADVDDRLSLDPVDVERKINERTRAVMYVGIGGDTGQYEQMVALCRKYNLKLILDAAHMAGTRLHGEIPGKEADVVVYSYQAVKNLPTADSGMLCFKDEEHDALCRKLSWLGISKDTYSRTEGGGTYKWRYDVDHLGYKYHGNSIMAAIAITQLKYLDEDNAYRRQLASWYDEQLSAANLPITPITISDGCESSRHLYRILTPEREQLISHLHANDIYPGVHYRDNTEYSIYAYANGTCPQAHALSQQVLSLPLHLHMTEADVSHICASIAAYWSGD